MSKKELDENRRLIVPFPLEEKKKLKKKATSLGLAMSQYVRMIVIESLNNKE